MSKDVVNAQQSADNMAYTRPDVLAFFQEQQASAQEYLHILADALARAKQAPETALAGLLDEEAQRALQLLDHHQRRWQRCISTQASPVTYS